MARLDQGRDQRQCPLPSELVAFQINVQTRFPPLQSGKPSMNSFNAELELIT